MMINLYRHNTPAWEKIEQCRRLGVLWVCLIIPLAAWAGAADNEKILADFEVASDVELFQSEFVHAETEELPDSHDPEYLAKSDWKYLVEFELNGDRASEGDHSLKVDFSEAGGGYSDYRILWFHLDRMQATDWRNWDALEVDIYNPGTEEVRIRANAWGEGGSPERPGERNLGKRIIKSSHTVPPGWHRLSVSTRARGFGDIDWSGISNFMIGKWQDAPAASTLYIDNIRLVRQLPGRFERLIERLRHLEQAADRTAEDLSEAVAEEDFSDIRRRFEGLNDSLEEADTAKRIEPLLAQAENLQEEAEEHTRHLLDRSLEIIGRELAPPDTDFGREHRLRPLQEPQETAPRRKLDALENIREIVEQELAVTRLQSRMEEEFAGEDFAVGIPEHPRAFYARPQNYAGPLGNSVSLAAARHEFEPFQLLLLPRDKPLSEVRITASELSGPGVIEADNLEIAPMGWQWMPDEERWLATMLRPDITGFEIKPDIQQPVWVNVYVPPETPPGDYQGTLTIEAGDRRSQEIDIELTVWPFTLPEHPSMKAFGASVFGDEYADDYARFLSAHRWNPHRLYMSGTDSFQDYSYDNFKRWHEWGGTNFNLFWANHNYKENSRLVERDEEGRLIGASDRAKKQVFKALDPILKPILEKDPEFLRHFTVYGFDEPVAEHMQVLEDLFGAVKNRYGDDLRTYFATHYPLWEQYGLADNIDIWAVTPDILTPEARDKLQAAGKEIIIYNIYASHLDPVGSRVQFWSVFKDGLDGVLHYNPGTAAGEGEGRQSRPWEPTLFPEEKRADGGLHRSFPENTEEAESPFGWRYGKRTMSTVAFEYWREGMQDIEYLHLLRDLRDRLAAADTGDTEHRRLIQQANRIIEVPETITAGAIGKQVEVEGEIVRSLSGTTDEMSMIMNLRRQAAGLIIRIQEVLDDIEA